MIGIPFGESFGVIRSEVPFPAPPDLAAAAAPTALRKTRRVVSVVIATSGRLWIVPQHH
jgi:hypothetical protein